MLYKPIMERSKTADESGTERAQPGWVASKVESGVGKGKKDLSVSDCLPAPRLMIALRPKFHIAQMPVSLSS